MNGVIRKLAAVLLAVVMVTAFTPFYGTGCIVNAENEDVAASQTDGGSDINEEVEITEETPAAEDAEADQSGDMDSADLNAAEPEADLQAKEDSNADDVSSEAGGSITDQEEKANVKLDADNDDVPAAVRGAGDSDPAGDDPGDGEEDPFEGVQFFGLERVGEGPNIIYDDGTVSFRIADEAALNVEGVTRYAGFVGVPGPDGWEEIKDCYTYDDSTKTITVDGSIIAAKFPDHSAPEHIGVQISGEDDEGNLKMVAGFNDVEFRYSEEFYEFPEDRDLLPGWDGDIQVRQRAYIENTEYPEREWFDIEISDVEVVEGRDLLEEFKDDSDDNGNRWWYYKAGRQYGDVTFRLTYTDLHNNQKTQDLHIHISGDVYECHFDSEGDLSRGLPGSEINLYAWAMHKYVDRRGQSETSKGLEYVWSVEEGQEFADVIRNESDHSKAKLVFKDMPEGEDFINGVVRVKLTITDTSDTDDPDEEKISQDRRFEVQSDYYEIFPTGLKKDLGVGETIADQKFEVRHYRYGSKGKDGFNSECYRTIAPSNVRWDFDDNAFTITKSDGTEVGSGEDIEKTDTFSLTRNAEYDSAMRINVDFVNDDGNFDHRDIGYWFDRLDYDVWFENWEERVFDDGTWSFDLQTRDDLDYSGVEIRFSAEGYRWNEDTDDDDEVEVPDECWSASGKTITVDGRKLADAGINRLLIRAEVFIGDRGTGRWAECNVNVYESCEAVGEQHLWLSAPAEYKDCTSKGTMKQICWKCLEKRIVSVAPRGHLPKKTAMKASTATKEGNVDYWICSDCKKYFFDAKCTKAASKDKVIIPRGTTIAKVAPQSKGFTVTWKKPTSSYLKHTDGYQVVYALNSKFTSGKKVVTISKNGTVSAKVTKLYAKKKYYVRVRTYRRINGKYYYSPWSPIKYTTTK